MFVVIACLIQFFLIFCDFCCNFYIVSERVCCCFFFLIIYNYSIVLCFVCWIFCCSYYCCCCICFCFFCLIIAAFSAASVAFLHIHNKFSDAFLLFRLVPGVKSENQFSKFPSIHPTICNIPWKTIEDAQCFEL